MSSLLLSLSDPFVQPSNPAIKSQRKYLKRHFESCLQKSQRRLATLIFYLMIHSHYIPNCKMPPEWRENFHSTVGWIRSQFFMLRFFLSWLLNAVDIIAWLLWCMITSFLLFGITFLTCSSLFSLFTYKILKQMHSKISLWLNIA